MTINTSALYPELNNKNSVLTVSCPAVESRGAELTLLVREDTVNSGNGREGKLEEDIIQRV